MRLHTLLASGRPAPVARVACVCLVTIALASCSQSDATHDAGASGAPAAGGSVSPGPTFDPGLRPIDRRALTSLVASGANRSCSTDIENEIEVRSMQDGNAIAAGLPQATYFVRVAQNAQGTGALAIVEQSLVPTDRAIETMVAHMQRVARAHHGSYDRWETQPVKSC